MLCVLGCTSALAPSGVLGEALALQPPQARFKQRRPCAFICRAQAATYNNQDKLVEYHRIFVKFGNPHPHASAGFGASFDDEGGGGGGGGASPARFEIQTDRSLASEAEVETYDDAPTVFIDGENMGALDMEPREGMAPMNQTRWLEDPTPEPPAQEAAPGQPGVALQGMLDYTQAGEYEEDEDNTPNSPGAQYGYAATRQQPLQHQVHRARAQKKTKNWKRNEAVWCKLGRQFPSRSLAVVLVYFAGGVLFRWRQL